jgi:hypothetical protein
MILAGLFCLLVTIEHLRMQYLAWDQLSLKAGEYESFEMKFDTSKNLKLDVFNESKNESNLPYLISRNNKNLFIHDTFRNETEFSAHFLKRKQLPDTSNLVLRNIRDGIFPETITCFKENNTCIYSK